MAIDTFFAYIGTYGDVEDAEADYDAVKALHVEAGLIVPTTPPSSSAGTTGRSRS